MYIVTASQMQELDRRTIREAGVPGKVLMERAGNGVVAALEQTFGSPRGKTVTIFCGKGNNGGDGFVVARLLRRKQCKVHVCLLAKPRDLKGDAKSMYQRFAKLAGTSRVWANPSEAKILLAVVAASPATISVEGTYNKLKIPTTNQIG